MKIYGKSIHLLILNQNRIRLMHLWTNRAPLGLHLLAVLQILSKLLYYNKNYFRKVKKTKTLLLTINFTKSHFVLFFFCRNSKTLYPMAARMIRDSLKIAGPSL